MSRLLTALLLCFLSAQIFSQSVSIAVTSGSLNICSGTSVTFTATPTNGGNAPAYQWKKNSSNVGTNSTTYTDAALANNDVINCILTNTVENTTTTSNSLTMTVSASPPSLSALSNQTVCAGTPVSVNFTSTGTPYTSWTSDNANIGSEASGMGNISFTAVNTSSVPIIANFTATPTTGSPELAYVPTGNSLFSIVNGNTNKVIGNIGSNNGANYQGICVSNDGNRLYVTNQNPYGNVSVFNTNDNSLVATITIGNGNSQPYGICTSADGSRVYVTDLSGNTVYVINTNTNTVIATIIAGSQPSGICVSPDGSRVYVKNYYGTVSVINTALNTVVATITASGSYLSDICVSPDGSRVYVNTGSSVSVINTGTNTVIATISGAGGQGICISPDGSRVYTSSGAVINTSTNTVIAALPSSGYAISINADGSRVYAVGRNNTNNTSVLSVINTSTNTVVSTLPLGSNFSGGNLLGNFIKSAVNGCTGTPKNFSITVNPILATFSLKVILQGSYNNGLMNDGLRTAGYIPTTTPYGGTETIDPTILTVSGNNAIVDWINVELRDPNNPKTVLQSRSALLQRDGDIVELDGISPVTFAGVSSGTFFIGIKHRNHLGFRTAGPITLSCSIVSLNFTDNSTAIYNANSLANPLYNYNSTGLYMMYAGDADGNSTINANDRSTTWNNRNKTGYLLNDFSLNGTVDATDRSHAWNNRNKSSSF